MKAGDCQRGHKKLIFSTQQVVTRWEMNVDQNVHPAICPFRGSTIATME